MVSWLLFVVCHLCFVVCCLLWVIGCMLLLVGCGLLVVRCLLLVGCCLWLCVGCVLFVVGRWLLFVVFFFGWYLGVGGCRCLLFVFAGFRCLLRVVDCVLFGVFCLSLRCLTFAV